MGTVTIQRLHFRGLAAGEEALAHGNLLSFDLVRIPDDQEMRLPHSLQKSVSFIDIRIESIAHALRAQPAARPKDAGIRVDSQIDICLLRGHGAGCNRPGKGALAFPCRPVKMRECSLDGATRLCFGPSLMVLMHKKKCG